MHKLFLLAGALLLLVAGQSAQATIVVTTCGKAVMTVGPEGYPGGEEAYKEYLRELNQMSCGYEASPIVMTSVETISVKDLTTYHPQAELSLDLREETPAPTLSEEP